VVKKEGEEGLGLTALTALPFSSCAFLTKSGAVQSMFSMGSWLRRRVWPFRTRRSRRT
jgi:hypothetical protein